MTVTVDSKWLLSHLDDPNAIIIDARGDMPYRFGHIKNALSLAIERVISTAPNGANLVIDAPIAEEVFTSLGIDDRKIVVVYSEYMDPSAARIAWTLMYHGHSNLKILDVIFESENFLSISCVCSNGILNLGSNFSAFHILF
jgi:thiosulfate/3-mercaptopyruvate sulfurtransferase